MENNIGLQSPQSNITRILKAAILGVEVFVFLLILGYYGPVLGSGESKYCARCHSMAPEYLTWQQY